MSKTIKGIFIDSKNKTIRLIEIENTLEAYYKLIGCEIIESLSTEELLKRSDTLCVDEEGYLKNDPTKPEYLFGFEGWNGPLIGNALIVGIESDVFLGGKAVDVHSTLEEIQSKVIFVTINR